MNDSSPLSNPKYQLNRTLVEDEITGCEDEILSLRRLISEAQQRRLGLNEKLNGTALINAILPRDVLTEIFFLVCEENLEHGTSKDLPGPYLLGKICKSWRNLVWSTPRLWTIVTIRFADYGSTDARRETRLKLLEEWLLRSQGCKLHIRIENTAFTGAMRYRSTNAEKIPTAVFRLLLNHSSEWKAFHSFPFHKMAKLMQEKAYSFPQLVSLTLTETRLESKNSMPLNFYLSPIQEAVIMDGAIFNPGVIIHWKQLRKLTILTEDIPETQILDLLEKLENLQSLNIRLPYIRKRDEESAPITPRLLPALEQLVVEDPAEYAHRFMSALSVPKLQRLQIKDGRDQTWVSEVPNLLSRSNCRLREFTLTSRCLETDHLHSLFSSLESIRKLNVTINSSYGYGTLSDSLIRAFNPNISNDNVPNRFFPNLTTFEYQGPVDFTFDTMTSMLQSRLEYSLNPTSDMKTLETFNIKYTNGSWISTIAASNPNSIPPFYIEIARLSTLGTRLDIIGKTS